MVLPACVRSLTRATPTNCWRARRRRASSCSCLERTGERRAQVCRARPWCRSPSCATAIASLSQNTRRAARSRVAEVPNRDATERQNADLVPLRSVLLSREAGCARFGQSVRVPRHLPGVSGRSLPCGPVLSVREPLSTQLGFPPFRGGLLIADGASHSPVPRCHRLVPRAAEAERPVSRGLALSGSLGGSLVEHLLVGDRREHLAGAVAPPMVVGIDERGDLPACLVLGGEVPSR